MGYRKGVDRGYTLAIIGTMSTTRFRALMFGEKHGHGGRSYRDEVLCQSVDQARSVAAGFLAENATGLVDLRAETYSEEGKLLQSIYQGAYRWDRARKCAVLGRRGT